MYLIWGTGNWLSHKTAIPIKWPADVLPPSAHRNRQALKEDSLTHGTSCAAWPYHCTAHRELGLPHGRQPTRQRRGRRGPRAAMPLAYIDQPGAYAYEQPSKWPAWPKSNCTKPCQTNANGSWQRHRTHHGTGHHFGLSDHDEFAGWTGRRQFVVLSVTHRVRNNLSADAQAG